MMNSAKSLPICLFLICLLLSACGTTTGGPQAWLDIPSENTTAPLAPLTLMAHAADNDGVASIEFFVDGQSIKTITTDGNRLEMRQYEWMPPGPGDYLIGARGINNNGNPGTIATALLTISGAEIVVPMTEETPTPTFTTTPEPTLTPTQMPTKTTRPTDRPTKKPTKVQPTETPKVDVIIPDPIVIDTTPPNFYSTGVAPDTILTESGGCPTYSRTVTVAAVVVDETEVGRVYAKWSIGGESGQVEMTMAYLGHAGTIGPVHTTGDLSITIYAQDTSGNPAPPETHHVTVFDCIE
jgi:hypothetical protein